MELLALHNPIKKPPRSDERDGELFCGTAEIPLALGTGSSNVYLSLSWLEYMREAQSVYVQTKSSSLSVIARNTSYANAHNFTQGETVQISSLGNIADILVSGTGSLYLRFIM